MKTKKITLFFVKWAAIITYLAVSLSFVSKRAEQLVCSSIEVMIEDSLQNAFITRSDVLATIEKQHSNLIGIPLHLINTLAIEENLKSLHAVKNVNAYKMDNGKLAIMIDQRKPIVRVINRNGQGYYIDHEGYILPLSNKFTSHVLVLNGNIDAPYIERSDARISSWTTNESNAEPLISQLFNFVKFIHSDKFWSSQITQIYVNNPENIELIPRVGSHTILLGNLDDYQTKLENLKLFYQKALPQEGWNKYQQINLKYRNQIVCTKR